MSESASQILAQFESLPASEQHALLAEMLRRSGELSSELLTEEQLTAMADEVFQSLDAEETRVNHTGTK